MNMNHTDTNDFAQEIGNFSIPENSHLYNENIYWNSMVYCDDENRKSFFVLGEKIAYGILLSMTILGATLGNALVILVILKNRSMRDVSRGTNMFLLSLAVADFLVGALMAPIALYTMTKECWGLPDILCTINSFMNSILLVTSVHTLMYIGIYKYISIKRACNLNGQPLGRRIWQAMIVIPWVWGCVVAILATTGLSRAVYKPKTMQCGPMYPTLNSPLSIVLHSINQLLNLFLPFTILTIAYLMIYLKIRANAAQRPLEMQSRRMSSSSHTRGRINDTPSSSVEESGVIKTLFIVLVCFWLCWLPYTVYTNYGAILKTKGHIPRFLNPIAYCFGYMNSACNPIIYAWRFPDFRNGYREILRKPSYIITFGPFGRRMVRTINVRSLSNVTSASNTSGHRMSTTPAPSDDANNGTHVARLPDVDENSVFLPGRTRQSH